jgi:rRNA processing protein Gar1
LMRLGKVLHLSKSGNLIVRLEKTNLPQTGSLVCDYKLVRIGTVNGVFGPVKSPYLSVRPTAESPVRLAGRILYLIEKE